MYNLVFLKLKILKYNQKTLYYTLHANEMTVKSHLLYSLQKDEIIYFHQTKTIKLMNQPNLC